jgi:hypothetical protein
MGVDIDKTGTDHQTTRINGTHGLPANLTATITHGAAQGHYAAPLDADITPVTLVAATINNGTADNLQIVIHPAHSPGKRKKAV